MENESDFDTFRAIYKKWFIDIEKFMNGETFIKKEIVINHEDTLMGKWFYQNGKKEYGELQQVQFVEAKFIKLHRIVEYLWDAKSNNQTDLIDLYYEDFITLSKKMIPNLDLCEEYIKNDKLKRGIINI